MKYRYSLINTLVLNTRQWTQNIFRNEQYFSFVPVVTNDISGSNGLVGWRENDYIPDSPPEGWNGWWLKPEYQGGDDLAGQLAFGSRLLPCSGGDAPFWVLPLSDSKKPSLWKNNSIISGVRMSIIGMQGARLKANSDSFINSISLVQFATKIYSSKLRKIIEFKGNGLSDAVALIKTMPIKFPQFDDWNSVSEAVEISCHTDMYGMIAVLEWGLGIACNDFGDGNPAGIGAGRVRVFPEFFNSYDFPDDYLFRFGYEIESNSHPSGYLWE